MPDGKIRLKRREGSSPRVNLACDCGERMKSVRRAVHDGDRDYYFVVQGDVSMYTIIYETAAIIRYYLSYEQ